MRDVERACAGQRAASREVDTVKELWETGGGKALTVPVLQEQVRQIVSG